MSTTRVRFAPSPTGPLHIGGVRTALFNYMFAKKHGGKFILRIEDTDQKRFVEGAEGYILNSLQWLGIEPDEGFGYGGDKGPYIQSERKEIYKELAHDLVERGLAYYAFDTPEEIEAWRNQQKKAGEFNPKYGMETRLDMRNSLSLPKRQVRRLLNRKEPYVIRLLVQPDEIIDFKDIIRGNVSFRSEEVDDKVIFKSDGLPTYHLANVIDDHLMDISHVIRGEEWISSTPIHVLLYRAFGWEKEMPQFAHLPLILKPQGQGKLSKRDGAKFGIPVFPMNWVENHKVLEGFKENGFLSEAVVNFLALLGWNPGNDEEILPMEKLIDRFALENVNKAGAKFNYEKAKWINKQYLDKLSSKEIINRWGNDIDIRVVDLMKPRISTLNDLYGMCSYFYHSPRVFDEKVIRKNLTPQRAERLRELANGLDNVSDFTRENLENIIKGYLRQEEESFGRFFPLLRVALTGENKGPDMFSTIEIIGKKGAINRIRTFLNKVGEEK